MYIDIDYIKARDTGRLLVELTDDGKVKAGTINKEKLDIAIEDAEALVNSKLSNYIMTPATAPEDMMSVLRKHVLNIAMYYLWKGRITVETPEQIKVDYSNSLIDIETLGEEFLKKGAPAKTTSRADFFVLSNKSHHDKKYTQRYLRRY